MPAFKAGILTVSDKGSKGEREDKSGPALTSLLKEAGFEVLAYEVVPDEKKAISKTLKEWADKDFLDLILTTGGTGLAPRDVTPEATLKVIDKEAPGIAEAMRSEGLKKTPFAMLSRGIAGIRGKTLIINLPGSLKGAIESLTAILPALGHGLEKLKGDPTECG